RSGVHPAAVRGPDAAGQAVGGEPRAAGPHRAGVPRGGHLLAAAAGDVPGGSGNVIASWRDRFTQLGRPRRSTVVLSVVFVLTLLLYLWVRPDPPPRAGRATADVPEAVTTTEPPPSTDTDPATTTTPPAADTTVTASTTPTTAASDTTAPR